MLCFSSLLFFLLHILLPAGGDVTLLLSCHTAWKVRAHFKPKFQESRLYKDHCGYHEEYSRHRHHEPTEFVWEGLERFRLARDRVNSFHPGVFGFKLRPQLLLINKEWKIKDKNELPLERSFSENYIRSIWGHVPLPLPSQWDPSRKWVLPFSFSRTPGILWLHQEFIMLLIYLDNYHTAFLKVRWDLLRGQCRGERHIMIRRPEHHAGCSDTHGPFYGDRLQPSVHQCCCGFVVKLKTSGSSKKALLVQCSTLKSCHFLLRTSKVKCSVGSCQSGSIVSFVSVSIVTAHNTRNDVLLLLKLFMHTGGLQICNTREMVF